MPWPSVLLFFLFSALVAAFRRQGEDVVADSPDGSIPLPPVLAKVSVPKCELHWKHKRQLEKLCEPDWHDWRTCNASTVSHWKAQNYGTAITIAAVEAACLSEGKDFGSLVKDVQSRNLPRPDKDVECYPTELAFVTPARLDPNEMPPEKPMTLNWEKVYGDEYTPLHVESSPVMRANYDYSDFKLDWLYNSMMVVSNNDYKGQLENLMAGLLQRVPRLVEARAAALLMKIKRSSSGAGEGEMLTSRMGPSNTLRENRNGARDAWMKADTYIQGEAAAPGALSGARLVAILKTAHEIMFTGDQEGHGGHVRASGEMTPVAGGLGTSDIEYYCISKIPEANMRPVSTFPDGQAVQYLDSESVEEALLRISNYVAEKLADGSESIVVLAARYMMALVSIHPFHDGNGRIGRLMMDFLFFRAGLQPPTQYNVMVAIFPRAELCWQPSPVAAANEVMKGLHRTYGIPYEPLPAAIDKSDYCPAGPKHRIALPL